MENQFTEPKEGEREREEAERAEGVMRERAGRERGESGERMSRKLSLLVALRQ